MMGGRFALLSMAMLGTISGATGCSPQQTDQQRTNQPVQDKHFIGCTPPFAAPGGRRVSHVLHQEGRGGALGELSFEVADPNLPPAISGNSTTSYRAMPLSQSGAELVRANVKQAGKPAAYQGMSDADQHSMNMLTFYARPIRFDAKAGYGKLSGENILPTDTLLFIEPGWAISVIVPKEKVGLAPAFSASGSAALAILLSLQNGCSPARSTSIPDNLARRADELEALADSVTSNDASEVMRPATSQDIALACRLAPGFVAAFENGRRKATPQQHGTMFDLLKKMPWRALPAQARCGGKGMTFQPKGFGEFVTAIA